ncbi:MAG: methylated-DNA--[protein]-cysteine S-methyltransferase [Thermodesulfobacteriota bacterium]|nr:methylated-DNA--[protein]-cysteine S-methyltransferase [Thermodesulfobacteriota bacterium]
MAGTNVPEVYCWEISAGDLNVYLASKREGALRIGLTLKKQADCIDFFRGLFPNTRLVKDYHFNRQIVQVVEAALTNKRHRGGFDRAFSCTQFQWRVLNAIKAIPFGETRRYGEVGLMVGKAGGARAVGQALGSNPLPLVFP